MKHIDFSPACGVWVLFSGTNVHLRYSRLMVHPVEFRLQRTPHGGFHRVKMKVPKSMGLRIVDITGRKYASQVS